jgi:hypothetical protein
VKVTPTVHEALGASAAPEHVSDISWKFGGEPGPEVVAVTIVPMLKVVAAVVFVSVMTLGGEVVVPVFPNVDEVNTMPNGVTFSGAVTACATVFDVLVM